MTTRLHVGNLSVDTTAASLTEAFQRDGRKVKKVDLVMSREAGRSRGFAFVEMETEVDASDAMRTLNGSQIDGRELRVTEAHGAKSRFGGTVAFGRDPVMPRNQPTSVAAPTSAPKEHG